MSVFVSFFSFFGHDLFGSIFFVIFALDRGLDLFFDHLHFFGMRLQPFSGCCLALTDLVALIGVPSTGLVEDVHISTDVDDFTSREMPWP